MPCSHVNNFIWCNSLVEPKGPYFTWKYMAIINQIRIRILHCKNVKTIMNHYRSFISIFSIFIWSGTKKEPKQQNNNRNNPKYHQKKSWKELFKIFHCFAPFTSLTNCAMAFLLFEPILARTFFNSSLCTLGFNTLPVHYETIHLLTLF